MRVTPILRAVLPALLVMAGSVWPAGSATAAEPLPLALGGAFTLVDHEGKTRDSGEFRGRLKLVYFGYTVCPHSCGMALNAMSAVLDELGADTGDVVPLFVTVDPDHDTPAVLAAHLANFHPAIVGLTGGREDIAAIRADFRIAAKRVADPGAFKRLIEHTTFIYLMGRDGEPLSLLPPMMPPGRMAAIVRGHL